MVLYREPAVAGRFYPHHPETLEREVRQYLALAETPPHRARAVVVPHAGYMYSGPVAGRTWGAVEVPPVAVVLCPNHTGRGARRSAWVDGPWTIPLGDVPIAQDLWGRIQEHCELDADRAAHLEEHSLEVQLPFLRVRRPEVRIVPICLARLSLDECLAMGRGLARAVQAFRPESVLLVASTDMSHFLSAGEAERLDRMAIDRMTAMDPEGLYEVVSTHDISMCGFVPTTVTLAAARELGATVATLTAYGNSGDTTGDFRRVVGYAGMIVQ